MAPVIQKKSAEGLARKGIKDLFIYGEPAFREDKVIQTAEQALG